MQNVVEFKISTINCVFDNFVQSLLSYFGDDAGFFYTKICDIPVRSSYNKQERRYNDLISKLWTPQNKWGGIFIFFNEITSEVLCIGHAVTFFPDGKSEKAGVVRYVNGNNDPMDKYFINLKAPINISQLTGTSKQQAIINHMDKYSIFFLCLKPNPSAIMNFDQALNNLKKVLDGILKPTI